MADPRATVWPGADITPDRFLWSPPPLSGRTLEPVSGLLAGAAEVDITPPPGMPKAGHSRNARDGDGFRTRLKARVLHLRAGRTSMAIVALDLLAGSAVVHHALARAIADTDVPISGLLLAVTHTHAGPGQFSGSEFYNRWASNRPGFDPDYTAFLVDRLSTAVHEAVAARVPARLAVGATEAWGFTRNRSLPAHVRNAEVADRRLEPQRPYAAVDPRLRMIRVDDETGPLAAFSWFSCHGTGISSRDSSYNADVWAYLNGELADRVERAAGRRPVTGSMVAAHGDMTPAVKPGMLVFPEAERVGRGIGAAAASLHAELGDRLTDTPALATGLRELDLATRPEVDGITLPEPMIGLPKASGANENLTFLLPRLPGFRAGATRRRAGGPHGPKVVLGPRQVRDRLVAPAEAYPSVMPLQVLEVDGARIVGLPFEVTATAGERIGRAAGTDLAWVSSLANDHCDYLTTEEEYGAQHYEGASTLFGGRQQQFVAGCVRRLADELTRAGAVEELVERRFDFSVRRYLPTPTGQRRPRVLSAPRFVEATAVEDCHWVVEWTDVAPGDLHWHEPLVQVEEESGKVVASDAGWRLAVNHGGVRRGVHRYRARWFSPPLGRPGKHRFVLLANAGQAATRGELFD